MKVEKEYKLIGARLRVLRDAAGLTQAEVAKALGVNRVSIARIETGNQRIPAHRLIEFAAVFGVDPSLILAADTQRANSAERGIDVQRLPRC